MTAPALLDLTELAARADAPADRLRHYAEVGLLPPAHCHGDRLGYPAAEVEFVRLLTGVEQLGVTGEDLTGVADAWRAGDCDRAQQLLTATLTMRLAAVQDDLAEHGRQAADLGPGTPGWAETTRRSVALYEDAARLQAVTTALASAPHAGPCGDSCGCRGALTTPSNGPRRHEARLIVIGQLPLD